MQGKPKPGVYFEAEIVRPSTCSRTTPSFSNMTPANMLSLLRSAPKRACEEWRSQ